MSLRSITLRVYANTGTTIEGDALNLTGRILKAGSLDWEADSQLTKISPGDVTFDIEDFDGSAWAFFQDHLTVGDGFRPAFCVLETDANSTRRFLGIIDPSRITRDQAERVVHFSAQDWSVMLASQPLEDWSRPLPKATASRPPVTGKLANSTMFVSALVLGHGLDRLTFLGLNNWLGNGDRLTSTETGAKVFKVTKIEEYPSEFYVWVNKPFWTAADFPREGHGGNTCFTASVSRLEESTAERNYYVATADVKPGADEKVYAIPLDTVDGIVAGDKLRMILSTKSLSWSVANVDAERLEVVTTEEVRDIQQNDRIFLDTESMLEVVYEDARAILRRAAQPYSIDLTRFHAATLPAPVLSWLPLRPEEGEDLLAVADIEPGLSNLRVIGPGGSAWDGSPELGWTSTTISTKRAVWTGQLSSAPATLMTDETDVLAENARRRNRAYDSFELRDVDNGDGGQDEDASVVVVHDYPSMRRVVITGGTSVSTQAWSGSAWGTASSSTWPGAAVKSACIFPGQPGKVLALTSAGLQLAAVPGSLLATLALTDSEQLKGVLATTPWGAYLVGPSGYGLITYSGGALALAWVQLSAIDESELSTTAFWPNTLAARTAEELVLLGRLDGQERSSGKDITETWMFRLAAIPVTADAAASILWAEKVTDGTPRLVGAFRDPTKSGRVMGQFGGRIWQVDASLPPTIERFKPSAMNAAECIEHVCQVHNAVAVPSPDGTLAIVSRDYLDSTYTLSPDVVKVEETRSWQHFYTLVRCSTADDAQYYDAQGLEGGRMLEVSRHPMVWTRSHAAGMAMSLVSWFGVPRNVQVQTWFYTDASAAPPWEALPRMARVKFGTDPQEWRVLGMSEDLVAGEARVTLIEIPGA